MRSLMKDLGTALAERATGGLMRKLMLKMDISMDGLCAEGDPDGKQDWLFSTADDESNAWEVAFIKNAGFHAMGHKTYRDMASY